MNGMIIMYNLTCITNYNSIYKFVHYRVHCPIRCQLNTLPLCNHDYIRTIQYYIEKGGKRIYVLLLDATKAFDKVSYKVLFDILLKKKCMP